MSRTASVRCSPQGTLRGCHVTALFESECSNSRGAVTVGTGESHVTTVQANRRPGLNLFEGDEQRHEKRVTAWLLKWITLYLHVLC
jgi:hypothetical protein